jgi:AmmeMemoRadiSam system protein A
MSMPEQPTFEAPAPPPLGEEDGARLVRIALEAVRSIWHPVAESAELPADDPLQVKAGVFVTLYHRGALRGCLGITSGLEPLWSAVIDMAVSSATRDPRFEPLGEEEFEDVSVEISVLGPLALLPAGRAPELIEIGLHGLMIRARGHSGLLLPQVAARYRWDPPQFLEELCYKAGLPAGAWRERDARISAFRCAIFKGTARAGAPWPETAG